MGEQAKRLLSQIRTITKALWVCHRFLWKRFTANASCSRVFERTLMAIPMIHRTIGIVVRHRIAWLRSAGGSLEKPLPFRTRAPVKSASVKLTPAHKALAVLPDPSASSAEAKVVWRSLACEKFA